MVGRDDIGREIARVRFEIRRSGNRAAWSRCGLRADKGFVRALTDPELGWFAYLVALAVGLVGAAIAIALVAALA